MSAGPVRQAVRGAIARRRVQTLVVGLVLLVSTAASVLAAALVVDSSSPFDHAFAAQRGAHLTATIDTARVTPAQLAATAHLAGVTATAGPFPEAVILPEQAGVPASVGKLPPLTLAGRRSPGAPVDDVTLTAGHWAQRPGQLVLASNPASPEQIGLPLGAKLIVTSAPGRPALTVVGLASSVTNSADGWVVPAQVAGLRASGAPASEQMLYRLGSAGSAAAVAAGATAVRAALPAGAVTGTATYLAAKVAETSRIGPFVPFLVAFGCIGLAMSLLIVGNVVSGAVVAGYRRIGILKSIGFTPGQVMAAYTGQMAVPAVIGCLGGLAVGNVLATALLRRTANAYGVGALGVPGWVDAAVPGVMLGLVVVAAVLPAARAARLNAVQAIAAGRAPRAGRGYAAHRLLGRLPLPRPVTVGLAAPFARPARTVVTMMAVFLGATVVIFAVGLSSSLNRVVGGLSRAAAQPVQVGLSSASSFQFDAAQQRAVEAALRAQPGTLHYAAETDQQFSVAGLTGQHPLTAFGGNAAWTGYPLVKGRWYTGAGQADVSSGFLALTGKAVGDRVTILLGATPIPVRIVGEVFDARGRGVSLVTGWRTIAPALAWPPRTSTTWGCAREPRRRRTCRRSAAGWGPGTWAC